MQQLKEWNQAEFKKDPTKYTHGVSEISKAIWEELLLGEPVLNQKPNGEPIFYLNDDDPNKDKGGVSLESQLYAAIDRDNVVWVPVPVARSRFSQTTMTWKKLQFGSALEHINYWMLKYEKAVYPKQFKWPHNGLTTLVIERENEREAKKAEKEKAKRAKDKELEDWIKGSGDGTGTREGFILCQKHSQLVEKIKAQNPKKARLKDWGFIERTVKKRLRAEEVVEQATKEKVLGTELSPAKVLEKMFKEEIAEGKQVRVINFRSIKSENYIYYLLFEVEGHALQRSTRTKDKRRAQAILKEGKKMFNSQEPANNEPEVKPEPMEAMETMETTEQESSAWSWLGGLFGKNEQVEVIDEPNEELDETVWTEPHEPEPMKEVLYNVRDANGALMKANDRILEITETLELKAKAKAFDELKLTLVPHHIAAVEALLAKNEQERKLLMKELDNATK